MKSIWVMLAFIVPLSSAQAWNPNLMNAKPATAVSFNSNLPATTPVDGFGKCPMKYEPCHWPIQGGCCLKQ